MEETKMTKHDRVVRKMLMKAAHKYAKQYVEMVGDYAVALKLALKIVWKYRKMKQAGKIENDRLAANESAFVYSEMKPEFVAGVPVWAIEKDLNSFAVERVLFHTEKTEVLKETAKALQIQFQTYEPEDDYRTTSRIWVAKSVMQEA